MIGTTVYLSEELKRRLERTARDRCTSEAEVIRAALGEHTASHSPAAAVAAVSGSGKTNIAGHVDEILAEGFRRD